MIQDALRVQVEVAVALPELGEQLAELAYSLVVLLVLDEPLAERAYSRGVLLAPREQLAEQVYSQAALLVQDEQLAERVYSRVALLVQGDLRALALDGLVRVVLLAVQLACHFQDAPRAVQVWPLGVRVPVRHLGEPGSVQLLRPVAGQDVLPRVRHFHAAPAGEQQPALEQVQSDLYLEVECRQQLPVFHDSRWPTARDSLPQHAFAPFVRPVGACATRDSPRAGQARDEPRFRRFHRCN